MERSKRKEKKNEERRRFVSLARPYHWFNSSLRGVRCAQPQPPAVHLLYHGVPFFLFLLPVAASQIFRLGFGSEEKKKKEKNDYK